MVLAQWDVLKTAYYRLNGKKVIRAHFSREQNFGDLFNYDLLRFFGYELIHEPNPLKSTMAMTGSILQAFPREFSGYVMGAGFIKERFNRTPNQWKTHIIRGPLSAQQCDAPKEVIYADPGILAPLVFENTAKRKPSQPTYSLGIIPHYRDKGILNPNSWKEEVLIIDVNRTPEKVMEDLQKCAHVASSSLHGLIFADALRIPNIHLKFGDRVLGGLHKFKDYYLGMNATPEVLNYSNDLTPEAIIERCALRYSEEILVEKQQAVISKFKSVLNELNE